MYRGTDVFELGCSRQYMYATKRMQIRDKSARMNMRLKDKLRCLGVCESFSVSGGETNAY